MNSPDEVKGLGAERIARTVVVVGAAGFIGSAVAARLEAAGYRVVRTVRRPVARPADYGLTVVIDIARVEERGWEDILAGADAVVNCVGLLQGGPSDSLEASHVRGPDNLFAACERVGVRRVVHISAVGVDRQQVSPFSESKLRGDERLMARDLDWVILRPAVVLGRGAVGASALIRGLAMLPWVPFLPGTADLQVVRLEDLTATVEVLLRPGAPSRVQLELVGPERLSFDAVVAAYRSWLGRVPARRVTLPGWLASILYRTGDVLGWLGWRPPLRRIAGTRRCIFSAR
jgi:uncharacterized protein YbjT (DUF2867 family)